MEIIFAIVVIAVVLAAVTTLGKMVRIVPQQRMDVVERFGRYRRTLGPGLNVIAPYVEIGRAHV